MSYSTQIFEPKCHNCVKKAVMRVYSHRNELWGEYCKHHGDYILKMLKEEEKLPHVLKEQNDKRER